MFNFLTEDLIRIKDRQGAKQLVTLPQLYVALLADDVSSLPAVRPHQRHAVHAFLCMLGALAVNRSGLDVPPANVAGWTAALRALTPKYNTDEPWHLVQPPDVPALLQPVIGPLASFKAISTADSLDMLVTAKNHDLKAAVALMAQPDDWLTALISLQTMEGFLGAGNYGISRMNGGFSNRPGFTLAPTGGIGAHIRRDLLALVSLRSAFENIEGFAEDSSGLALVWLMPWDGTLSLSPKKLDPYYIEICRRVRLAIVNDRITAFGTGSKVARIAFGKDANGRTGDAWTPIETKDGINKALTVDARGFHYKRLSDILFEQGFELPPLQKIQKCDVPGVPFTLVCRALARGQGKTEGWFERRIAVSPAAAKGMYLAVETESIGTRSQLRIELAGKVRSALRFGLTMLFQNGTDKYQVKDPSSSKRADAFLDMFEAAVDHDFFAQLFDELACETEADLIGKRRTWLLELQDRALAILRMAEAGSPRSSFRKYRAIARAESAFRGSFFKAFKNYLQQEEHHAA